MAEGPRDGSDKENRERPPLRQKAATEHAPDNEDAPGNEETDSSSGGARSANAGSGSSSGGSCSDGSSSEESRGGEGQRVGGLRPREPASGAGTPSGSGSAESASPRKDKAPRQVCCHFLRGRCLFGSECRWSHPWAATSGAAPGAIACCYGTSCRAGHGRGGQGYTPKGGRSSRRRRQYASSAQRGSALQQLPVQPSSEGGAADTSVAEGRRVDCRHASGNGRTNPRRPHGTGRWADPAKAAEALRLLCGRWLSEDAEGQCRCYEVAIVLSPGHADCAELVCRSSNRGSKGRDPRLEVIRCEHGHIMLGPLLLGVVGKRGAAWGNWRFPEMPQLVWMRDD